MVWIDPEPGSFCKAQYTCKSRWLCSCQRSWGLACSTLCSSLWSEAPHNSVSSNRSLFSVQLLLSCQVCANQWGFFPPFLFYVCPTNKNTVEMGKPGRSYCFLWCMVTIWAKIEPDWSPRSVCYSAGKGAPRAWASPVASAGLCAAAPCGGPAKVALRAVLWILVFFLSILWMLLLSDRKWFSSSIPDHAACCLAHRVHSFLLLAGLI